MAQSLLPTTRRALQQHSTSQISNIARIEAPKLRLRSRHIGCGRSTLHARKAVLHPQSAQVSYAMERPLRLLIVDDQRSDAELSALQIARGGYPCTWRRVETATDFSTELREFAPDLILSDFSLPQFDGLSALELAVNEAPGVPFIFVSGTIGEKRATDALERGAADYVSKDDLTRLVPAVARVITQPSAHVTQISSALRTLTDEGISDPPSPFDPLTGLPKRESFCKHLCRLLRVRTKQDTVTTVIVFNIEHLRDINDTHGRYVGDHLLQGIAERLKRRFGGSDNLAYSGDGTFVAVFEEHRHLRGTIDDSATAVFGHPFAIGGCMIEVTVKCGLARHPIHGRDAETLLQFAEAALDRIREHPKARPHRVGSPTAIVSEPRTLEQRLRLALKYQEFEVHYQPLIERVSGRIVSVEALLRWRDPEGKLTAAGVFLPTLEHSGLIVPVGEWVLSQVVRDSAHWLSIGLPNIRVAVNTSPMELGRKDFVRHFLDTVRLARNRPGIDIEITESALLEDTGNLHRTLKLLRAEGVRIAIDDFGMVPSSASRLSEFPVDSLKIDRTFISQLNEQPQSQVVVSTIMALARAYGLRTIAEGVETIQQLQVLDALGCEQAQGYLHSPAVPADELEFLIAARASRAQS
jgi:diguanylate cyclase (GGDEF)-like protein